ncbi:MAG TPA: HIT domain-containing protein [Acidimicrobiales bacterium]|nr:HIT domain-containing protein [Acidimicrobiales bacterium]
MSGIPDCIFCEVVAGRVPSRQAYAGPLVYGFHDLQPVTPVHVLLVPRAHVASVAEVTSDQAAALAEMMMAAKMVANEEGVANSGYRLVFNVGEHAGASVPHLHMHLLGGRRLSWPPG